METINCVQLYAWADAPDSLREIAKELVPDNYTPMWVSYAANSQPPAYLLLFLSKAWIEDMQDGWHKVFIQDLDDGGEMRVGCEKKR